VNGIHDMGGITNFGPVRPEANEPVFHEEWERRVFGMGYLRPVFLGPIDRVRHASERMDAFDYLTTSYYEHWLHSLEMLAQELGYVTADELATGRSSRETILPHPARVASAEGDDPLHPSRGYYESWLVALAAVLADKRILGS
jgi:nitrile hydratase